MEAKPLPSQPKPRRRRIFLLLGILSLALVQPFLLVSEGQVLRKPSVFQQTQTDPYPLPVEMARLDLMKQSKDEAFAKSAGCIACHEKSHDPHFPPGKTQTFHLGCIDCHGGDPSATDKHKAHVAPRFPDAWKTSANPARTYTLLNHESPEFIMFNNPGDLRIAHLACGNCHAKEVQDNRMSMMTHGCMLWGAALYNNGAFPFRQARHGESYSMHGVPQRLQTYPPPTQEQIEKKGIVPYLDPLPRFEISQPGNILRIFERGGRFRPEVGIPEREEEPGRPRTRLSNRGLGTENRTDPVFVGLQRTRLLDPTLNMMGTNDHPGDYRHAGCTACHVIYANDRSPVNSGPYAKYGHIALSAQSDPSIPRNERGHPIKHEFTRAIPSSQCIVCHTHPGTTVMNSYLGFMWWDEETDGEFIYPKKQMYPTAEQFVQAAMNNPNESSARNLLSDPDFLERTYDLNPYLKNTQFGDFHGHGWLYRAVFKKDRKGRLLDHAGRPIEGAHGPHLMTAMKVAEKLQDELRREVKATGTSKPETNVPRDHLPVHLMDIHLERGMHCVDCHFIQDVHGNSNLYQEVRAAVEIQCVDCHGTISKYTNLRTSGPASTTEPLPFPIPDKLVKEKNVGRDLSTLRTPFGKRRFEVKKDEHGRRIIVQNSMVDKDLSWIVKQTRDVIDPTHGHYNERARLAKTVRFKSKDSNELVWGDIPTDKAGNAHEEDCAHSNQRMTCITCHSSWNPSCFGCHLVQKANKKMPNLHNEGENQRNYTAYNFQTLRDDVFMLAKDGDVTGNRVNPSRSSCAIHVGSYNNNRDNIYIQQQTISSDGLSGVAFSTNVPHTVRGAAPVFRQVGHPDHGKPLHKESLLPGHSETKSCSDCHVSKHEDNNAVMAQLLMHGTGAMNFIGRYAWVAAKDHGIWAPVVTEGAEPQAVIGSSLHKLAFPDFYKKHVKHDYILQHAHEHPGIDIAKKLLRPLHAKADVLMVQNRGEYLYAACGADGVRVFDIAFIDNKSFAERITTAPVSPIGQKFHVPTSYAQAIAAPCTPAPDPTRKQLPQNKEPAVHLMYAFLYVADKHEGLILIGAGTTIDGNPVNNFLKREVTFNPKGVLNGARYIAIAGTYAYVLADAGLVVVDIDNPKEPKVTSIVELHDPKSIAVQFRYAYVTDHDGVKVLDVTDLARPQPVTTLKMEHAHGIYLCRTYAYVAAGKKGLVILDVEDPRRPRIDQVYDAHGKINDAHDVKIGITYVSQFAYIADGHNGLRVVQLTGPETPGNYGFSPRPTPKLVATFPIPEGGHALTVARGLDRDRAVDEAGHQIAVFGRTGARPLNLEEQRKMYFRNGRVWSVSDDPADPLYRNVRMWKK